MSLQNQDSNYDIYDPKDKQRYSTKNGLIRAAFPINYRIKCSASHTHTQTHTQIMFVCHSISFSILIDTNLCVFFLRAAINNQ